MLGAWPRGSCAGHGGAQFSRPRPEEGPIPAPCTGCSPKDEDGEEHGNGAYDRLRDRDSHHVSVAERGEGWRSAGQSGTYCSRPASTGSAM